MCSKQAVIMFAQNSAITLYNITLYPLQFTQFDQTYFCVCIRSESNILKQIKCIHLFKTTVQKYSLVNICVYNNLGVLYS